MATPKEIAGHLERAMALVRDNPKVCPAKAIIIYAWNEYDEGGGLAPTRGLDGKPDTGRLDAIAGVLNQKDASAPHKDIDGGSGMDPDDATK